MARRTAKVIAFPARPTQQPAPDAVRLGYDFGRWCVELFTGETFKRRRSAGCKETALAEVARLESEGLRRLPPSGPAVSYGGAP